MRILHCGDIHIRTVSRYLETKQIFDNLFKRLSELEKAGEWDKSVDRLYVGGDIVHSKLQLSPEAVSLVHYFFNGLSNFGEVDIILGNHDCNLGNPDRPDAISPIINALNNPKLHLYKNPELVDIPNSNLTYGVFSVLHDNKGPEFIKDDSRFYIALFHGAINNSLTDINFKLSSDHVIEDFKQYDCGLFADIHKRQDLDKKGMFAYSGSLFQNNYGESVGKGCLVWDFQTEGLKKKWKITKRFEEITNDYGFITLDLSNQKDLTKLKKIKNCPAKPSIRVIVESDKHSITDIKELTNRLRLGYQPTEIKVISKVSAIDAVTATAAQKLEDVSDLAVQESLFKEFFKGSGVLKKELKELIKINKEVNSNVDSSDKAKYLQWQLNTVNFSNTFSYGKDNVLDFSKLQGVTGIFAPNAAGKSSIFSTILYALYNNTPSIARSEEVVNKLRDKAEVQLDMQIGEDQYRIERKTTVPKSARETGPKARHIKYGVRTDLNFMKLIDDEWHSLNGKQRTETETIIRKIFGTYDDFLITSMASQGEITRFIDAKESERIDYLMKFLGLDIFNQLHAVAKTEIAEVKALLKAYEKQDFSQSLLDLTTRIALEEAVVNEQQTKKKTASSSVDTLYSQIVKLASQVVEINDTRDIVEIDSALATIEHDTQQVREDIFKLEGAVTQVEEFVKEVNPEQLNSALGTELEKLNVFNEQIQEVVLKKQEFEYLSKEVIKDTEIVEILHDHEYDSNCQYCISCNFVKDAIDTKVALKEKNKNLAALNKTITELNNKASLSADVEEKSNKLKDKKRQYEDYQNKLEKGELKLESLQHQLNTLASQQNDWEEKRRNYFRQEEQIKRNKEVRQEIATLESKKIQKQQEEKGYEEKIMTAHSECTRLQSKIENIQSTLKEFKNLEIKLKVYTLYLEATHRTGIPYQIVQEQLGYVNSEINKILSSVVNFNVAIEIGENTKSLPIYLNYNDDDLRRIETGSGMEKLLSSIAIRAALIKISSLPKCNIFAIDEGFGSLDSDNLNEMKNLFEYLKTLFDHILIITHIEGMQDVCDNIVNVEKKDDFSRILIN
tara:strand:- start:293 stop:3502 length:3210 start_codon:yes stop_codon:yes gene_type:complete